MRAFVEKQEPSEKVACLLMCREIKEEWFALDCPACQAFGAEKEEEECIGCPLAGTGDGERTRCCHGLWDKMDNAPNWGRFLSAMDKVIAFIREKRDEAKAKQEKT
jgi:hypothetical protein